MLKNMYRLWIQRCYSSSVWTLCSLRTPPQKKKKTQSAMIGQLSEAWAASAPYVLASAMGVA